jgi:hypothetical protein
VSAGKEEEKKAHPGWHPFIFRIECQREIYRFIQMCVCERESVCVCERERERERERDGRDSRGSYTDKIQFSFFDWGFDPRDIA